MVPFLSLDHEEMLRSSDVATLLESSVKNVSLGNGSCTEMVSLRVATANVNTLSPSDESVDGPTLARNGQNPGSAVSVCTVWSTNGG